MRIVYGAGAVAAMSVMAVGLVQPDWTSTADQGPTDDSYADDPGTVAALPDGKTEIGLSDPTPGKGEVAASVNVRHVIRYIYLRPGQTAPPGATVIWASAAPARVGRHASDPTSSPRPRQHNVVGNNGGGPVTATPRPTARPAQAPAATPRPTPRPTPRRTPTTRQSGHR